MKNKNLSSVEGKFKKLTNKNWIPTNNHHSIETLLKQHVMKFKKKIKKNTTIEIFQPNNQRAESNARTAI